MCRLCNTDNAGVGHKCNSVKGSWQSYFKNVVLEYTGEYPCKKCIEAVGPESQTILYGGIDTYIIDKLFRRHCENLYSKNNIQAAFKIFYLKPKDKERTIEKCIVKRIHGVSGGTSYIVRRRIKGKRHCKSFPDLSTAREYRDNLKKHLPE